jgi:adenylate cyclase
VQIPKRLQHWLAGGIATVLASFAVLGASSHGTMAGWSIDSLFWLRNWVYGARHTAAESSVALVVIDEDTYSTSPFSDYPKDLWTPQFGQLISAIDKAEAKVIGFDIILPTSPGRLLPGYDRDFLVALSAAASSGRFMMAKFAGADKMQWPSIEQVIQVGKSNIRAVNVIQDDDGIVRRFPLSLALAPPQHGTEPTLPYELARRAGAAPTTMPDMLLNFDSGHPYSIYSFADLIACVDVDFFRKHFANKVVIIGTNLDVEDLLLP